MSKQQLLTGVSLAAALLLGACANGPDTEVDPDAAFPVTVGPHMETVSLANPSDMNARLPGYTGAFMAAGNGAVTISAPSAEAARQVADKMASLGVPRARIVIGAQSTDGAVNLSYVGYGATSPDCNNWDENVSFTMYNLPTHNFGCATQHNLAAQIADPRDLQTPQAMTPPDTERRMTVIDKWRRGEPTAAQKTPEQSGAVSDVAH